MLGVSRRRILKYGLFGSAVLAAGGVGLGLQSTKLRPLDAPLKVLTQQEYSILSAIVDRMFPDNPPFESGSAARVPESVDTLMSTMPVLVVQELKQALALMENAVTSFVFFGTPRPFSQCGPVVQDEILEDWRTSSLLLRRTVFHALNSVCAGAYYGDSARFKAIGYGGPLAGLNPEANL